MKKMIVGFTLGICMMTALCVSAFSADSSSSTFEGMSLEELRELEAAVNGKIQAIEGDTGTGSLLDMQMGEEYALGDVAVVKPVLVFIDRDPKRQNIELGAENAGYQKVGLLFDAYNKAPDAIGYGWRGPDEGKVVYDDKYEYSCNMHTMKLSDDVWQWGGDDYIEPLTHETIALYTTIPDDAANGAGSLKIEFSWELDYEVYNMTYYFRKGPVSVQQSAAPQGGDGQEQIVQDQALDNPEQNIAGQTVEGSEQTAQYAESEMPANDLGQYLGGSFDTLLRGIIGLAQTQKDDEGEKWGNEYMSVSGTDHDHIVRARLNENASDYQIYGIKPGMHSDAVPYILNPGGFSYLTESEGWFIYTNSNGILIAFQTDGSGFLTQIYCALEGYLPISY